MVVFRKRSQWLNDLAHEYAIFICWGHCTTIDTAHYSNEKWHWKWWFLWCGASLGRAQSNVFNPTLRLFSHTCLHISRTRLHTASDDDQTRGHKKHKQTNTITMVVEPLASPAAWIWWTHAARGVGGLAHARSDATVDSVHEYAIFICWGHCTTIDTAHYSNEKWHWKWWSLWCGASLGGAQSNIINPTLRLFSHTRLHTTSDDDQTRRHKKHKQTNTITMVVEPLASPAAWIWWTHAANKLM